MKTLEPVLLLLFAGMIFFTLVLFAAEKFYASDSQLFQVVAGLLTGITGAFLGRVKPPTQSSDSQTQASVSTQGSTVTVSTTPPVP